MKQWLFSAAVVFFGVHRMTHAEFNEFKRLTLAEGEYHAETVAKQYWAAVRVAIAKGKAGQIPEQTMQTYKRLSAYSWFG